MMLLHVNIASKPYMLSKYFDMKLTLTKCHELAKAARLNFTKDSYGEHFMEEYYTYHNNEKNIAVLVLCHTPKDVVHITAASDNGPLLDQLFELYMNQFNEYIKHVKSSSSEDNSKL